MLTMASRSAQANLQSGVGRPRSSRGWAWRPMCRLTSDSGGTPPAETADFRSACWAAAIWTIAVSSSRSSARPLVVEAGRLPARDIGGPFGLDQPQREHRQSLVRWPMLSPLAPPPSAFGSLSKALLEGVESGCLADDRRGNLVVV